MTEELQARKAALPVWARVVLILISFFIFAAIFQFIGMIVAKVPMFDKNALEEIGIKQNLIMQAFGFIATIIVVYFFRKKVDRRSIKSLGFSFKGRAIDILYGFVLALFIIGVGTLILYALGYINIQKGRIDVQTFLLSFILFIIVSLNEEILIRGYVLNNLLTKSNKFLALVISAIVFTLLHSLNFNISFIAVINLFLAGIVLGAAYIFTKNLWLPISLHLFWNFFQGPVLGYSVSGQKMESLYTIQTIGNKNLTGGEFGFEGSIICSVLIVVAIAVIFYSFRTSLSKKSV